MSGEPGGWIEDAEDWDSLDALPDESAVLELVGNYEETALDPREVINVENQGQQGACQGHSISTCLEWCYCIATGNYDLQLSRAMGYYESQRLDGISGDRGSTISAGVKLATQTGICEEPKWPYPSRYNARRPGDWAGVLANAENYKGGTSRRLQSYEGIRTFLGSGQGGINIGIGWGNGMSGAVIESYRSGGGGHAIALLSLSERKDRSGNPYIWMCNSWGRQFGNAGWSEWSPNAVKQMMQSSRTVAIGVSDMPNVEPREFTLEDWKRKLRF